MPHKCCAPTESFANCCNVVTTVNAPTAYNVNEFMPLSLTSSQDWTIDPSDNTKLICQNPGMWNIMAQYQCGSLTTTQCQISGWYFVNGFYQDQSIAVNSLQATYHTSVLAIGLAYNFNKGDFIQLGIRVKTTDTASPPQQGCFALQANNPLNTSGYNIPSLILTMAKR